MTSRDTPQGARRIGQWRATADAESRLGCWYECVMRRTVLVALMSIVCGLLMGSEWAAAAPSRLDDPAVAQSAKRDLVAARKDVPFDIKLPRNLPKGLRLVRVSWAPGTSVDLFWHRPNDRHPHDGDTLHIWESAQSSAELGAKDPMATGTAIAIRGTEWLRAVVGGCSEQFPCLTRRFDDRTILQMNGTLSETTLRRLAETIR